MHLWGRLLLVVLLVGLMAPILPTYSTAQEDTPPLLHIGEVQGVVSDDLVEANIFDSPYVRERVQVAGIITNVMAINISGRVSYGFFLQEPVDATDGDPLTSDGIYAVSGGSLYLGDYPVTVGDSITIEGRVEEYYDMTRLIDVEFVSFASHIDDIDTVVPAIELNPQGLPDEVYRYYERIENMRVHVPAGSMVVAPTHWFSSSNDTEVYVVRADASIMQRANIFERRVFRDIHPLDDGEAGDNLYRLSVEANILKAQAGDYEINFPAYNTFDLFTNELTGNIIYAYGRYTLQIDVWPVVETLANPVDNNPLPLIDRADTFSIGTYNVENLYDFYNDPFDREDNPADLRLNYVPRSLEPYQTKVAKLAIAILSEMHAPDIVAFQEIEDQDVCVGGGQLHGTCSDEADNADGLTDVLHDVAIEIGRLTNGAVVYLPTIDRDSVDERGITQAYLYRSDRVELAEATEDHPIFGTRPTDPAGERFPQNTEVSNPKALNERFGFGLNTFDRAPLVALFRIYRHAIGEGDFIEVYVANNHFKSNPEENRALHEAQSNYNLALMQAVQAENPDVYYVLTGDLNSYRESSEISLIEAQMVNVSREFAPESDYTYIYAGQAQTLDYLFASPALGALLLDAGVVHINADYAYNLEADSSVPYHGGDHDPVVAIFGFPE